MTSQRHAFPSFCSTPVSNDMLSAKMLGEFAKLPMSHEVKKVDRK